MDIHYQVSRSKVFRGVNIANGIYRNSVPIALPAFIIMLYALPKDFPYHGQPNRQPKSLKFLFSKSTFNRIDIAGTLLILFATLALTAGFEEADKKFPWRSAYVITLLTVSGFLWIATLIWERHVTLSSRIREPILPWRFFKNREMMGILLYGP